MGKENYCTPHIYCNVQLCPSAGRLGNVRYQVMVTNVKANKAPKFGLESTYLKIYNLAMSLSEEM